MMITIDVRLVATNQEDLQTVIGNLEALFGALGPEYAATFHDPRAGRKGGYLSYGTLVFPRPRRQVSRSLRLPAGKEGGDK
jgi:hypothetical protein